MVIIFNCECGKRFKNPVICQNCNNTFCKEHLKGKNKCPRCKKISNFSYDKWLNKCLNYLEKEEEKKKKLLKKCLLCDYEGEKDSFWVHLMETHKDAIIDTYTDNGQTIIIKNKTNENNYISSDNNNNISITQSNFSINSSYDKDLDNNIKQNEFINFNERLIIKGKNKLDLNTINDEYTKEFKKNNLTLSLTESSINNISSTPRRRIVQNKTIRTNNEIPQIELFTINNQNSFKQTIKGLIHCNFKNEKIKCKCCPDHICRDGNCLCPACMTYNTTKLKLSKGQLINKSGKIATYEKGHYHCGGLTKIIIDLNGNYETYYHSCTCDNSSCDYCKVLNIHMKDYLPDDIYYDLKNK